MSLLGFESTNSEDSMSIKNTIAHGSTPHGWMHVYHESDVDSLDEMHPNEDVFINITFGRTETTHRIPVGLWRIIVRQLLPNSPVSKTPH